MLARRLRLGRRGGAAQALYGLAIEFLVEDGTDGAVGARADLQGAKTGRLHSSGPEAFGQTDDAAQERKPCSG